MPGVGACCMLARRWRFVQFGIFAWIVLQAFLIFCAIPEYSILAWKRATRPLSQRSSGGTYDSVSSWRIGVALNAPSTVRSPWFCCTRSLAASPIALVTLLVG